MKGWLCALAVAIALAAFASVDAVGEHHGTEVQVLDDDDLRAKLPTEVDGIKVADLRKAVHAAVVKAVAEKNAGKIIKTKSQEGDEAIASDEKKKSDKADAEDSSPEGQAKLQQDVKKETDKRVSQMEDKEDQDEAKSKVASEVAAVEKGDKDA